MAVIVTGAGGLLGRAVTSALAEVGYQVVPVDRIGGQTQNDIEIRVCDVADQQEVEGLVEDVTSQGYELYGLVNAAALIPTAGLHEVDAQEFAAVMNVNAWGSFNMARVVSRAMAQSGKGRIVNIASVAAYAGGLVGGPHYAASKAALIVLSKILAKELAVDGITVNAIAPGALESPATSGLSEEVRAGLISRIPKGRLGTMAEIANAVVFLLSPAADYMTGATLDINGGVYLR
ncbi:SDR family NAD(P)-dependent oxidoreductase [Arthrobacter sp. 31Y]|uniref:SDR family NAD(P)-dependent oxidoreductase n=1 Tax=Arthrobacter sp. 31Y TaxID=1115632 RepID=UPI0004656C45|nr:SDR family NAD(P)-dependent oxidoreductase [Arthrobacter sp. 31Y]